MFFITSCNYQLQNVMYIGLCFTVLFASDYTVTNMQKTLISSIHDDHPGFSVEGYTSLGLAYTFFSISLWFGPSMIRLLGLNIGMSVAALCYSLYILAFSLENSWAIYSVVVIGGIAGGIIWTGEGDYVALNSTADTISRNVSIFWAFLQCSSLIGNSYTFYKFEGKSRIDEATRQNVVYVLGAIAAVSSVMFFFLRPVNVYHLDVTATQQRQDSPLQALQKTWTLFTTRNIAILNLSFIYTGLQHAFLYAVYSPSVGFTENFGNESKQLIALSGIFIALGEITGGGLLIIFSDYLNTFTRKRSAIVVIGITTQIISYLMVFLNLPNDAVLHETTQVSFIKPNAYIAMLCSFLFGIGDACINTQNYSILAVLYPEASLQSTALYKFIESLLVAIGLFCSSHLTLHVQLSILVPVAVIGLLAFIKVDKNTWDSSS